MTRDQEETMADVGKLILRLAAGGFMAFSHGYPKLMKLLAGNVKFADPFGIGMTASLALAVLGEFIAGITISLGLFTRASAVPAAITMAVAAFMIHAGDPFKKREMALMYLAMYLAVGLLGPGRYSADAKLFGDKR